MIKTILKGIGGLLVLSAIGYFVGPKVTFDQVDNTPTTKIYNLGELESFIAKKEAAVQNLKGGNGAKIVWADSTKTKTEYSIVYLHGFTASHNEGFPMHINIADSIDANLYLPRLPDHGILDTNAMKHLTPKMLVEASKDAIAVGKTIGEKVILMGCSTGGTLALYLAAGDPSIESLVLLSPNIELSSKAASLMTGPWGRQLAYQLVGTNRDMTNFQNSKEYWTYLHHTNGLLALQALMDQTMTEEVFEKIEMPLYCGYYYKDVKVQDPTVSVGAMLDMQKEISTPEDQVEFEAFPNGNHVLGSIYKNDNWKEVQDEVLDFIKREVL